MKTFVEYLRDLLDEAGDVRVTYKKGRKWVTEPVSEIADQRRVIAYVMSKVEEYRDALREMDVKTGE